MSIIDIIIILIILSCAVVGAKRGFIKETVSFLGFFIIVILSFLLKNPISSFMYHNLPFFSFGGLFKGVTALNIILYEVIAFFIVMAVLTIIFKVIMFATSVIEKLIDMIFILGVPSKILGFIVGTVEGFIWSFIVLYISSLPLFNFSEINESKLKGPMLASTPILSHFTKDFKEAMDEFSDLREKYEVETDSDAFNYETLEVLLKYKIISVDACKELDKKGKLKIDNVDALIEKYKEK